MRIHQVVRQLGITKKAINYYEQHGLILSIKLENGYRDFDETAVRRLEKIHVLRRLDMPVSVIKSYLDGENKTLDNLIEKYEVNEFIHNEKKKIAKKIKDNNWNHIENFRIQLDSLEMMDNRLFFYALERNFPDGLGLILSSHFKAFSFECIDTIEKKRSLIKIVEYIDNLASITIPEVLNDLYRQMADEEVLLSSSVKSKERIMCDIKHEDIEQYRIQYKDLNNTINESFPEIYSALSDVKDQLLDITSTEDYKNKVLKNVKILSHEYNTYTENLMKISESSKN